MLIDNPFHDCILQQVMVPALPVVCAEHGPSWKEGVYLADKYREKYSEWKVINVYVDPQTNKGWAHLVQFDPEKVEALKERHRGLME